ncbi:MAG: hypothetical protein P8L84_09025 [Methylococcaceae bacterium]|nr:hypothetical protein [Methylococcaceae bacterium]
MKLNKIVGILFVSLLIMSTTSQAQSALDNKYFAQQLEYEEKKRIRNAEKKKKRAETAAAAADAKAAAPVVQPKPSVSKATTPAPAMMGDCKQIQAHYKKMCMTKGDMIRWIK